MLKCPSLEDLEKVAAAAGARLDVRVVLPEAKLVELVGEQLDLAPTERLKALLGNHWPGCRDALHAAYETGELAVGGRTSGGCTERRPRASEVGPG